MAVIADDLLTIIPTRGREDMLADTVKSFRETAPKAALIIAHDGEPVPWIPIHSVMGTTWGTMSEKRLGYWGTLNRVLAKPDKWPLIGYFANDCVFHEGWLEAALECWNESFPDGAGLLQVNDGVHGPGFHACHGIISRRMLWVMYGRVQFPGYDHHFADGELSMMAKELGRFQPCEGCEVEHLHPDVQKRPRDEVDLEAVKPINDPPWDRDHANWRWNEWIDGRLPVGGLPMARERLLLCERGEVDA